MGYYKFHVIQAEVTIPVSTVDVTIAPGNVASYGGSNTAILYVKTASEVAAASMTIQVFNVVFGSLVSLGGAVAITTETTTPFAYGCNFAGGAYTGSNSHEPPLSPHFLVRQILSGSAASFDVTLAIAWQSSSFSSS